MQLLNHFHELTLDPANARQLKALILQMAVQGKLTAEWRKAHSPFEGGTGNPDEHNAALLLQNIKAEKARLILEDKIKKEKPLPEITSDEIPYVLPEGWVWCRIGDAMNVFAGASFKSQDFNTKGGVKCIKITNAGVNEFIETQEFLPEDLISKYSNYIVKKGDIILALTRPYINSGLKVSLCPESYNNSLLNQRVAAIRTNCFFISNKFVYTFLSSSFVLDFYKSKLDGKSQQPNMKMADINELVFSLAPLEEQKAIVEIVDRLFKEVEQLEQLTESRIRLKEQFAVSALRDLTTNNTPQEWEALKPYFHTFFNEEANIKKLRETILQLAVQGKLTARWRKTHSPFEGGTGNADDHDAALLLEKIKAEKARLIREGKIKKEKPLPEITPEEIPYELPEGWVWCRMQEVGIINPRNKADDDTEAGFSKMANIESTYSAEPKYEFKTWGEIKNGFTHFQEDDVAFAKITPCFENSKACVFRKLPQGVGAGTTELHVFRRLTADIEPDFIYCIFKSPHFLHTGESKMTGSAGQKRVPKDYFANYFFGLPPTNEQKAIVETVNRLMALCDRLEQESTQSNTQADKWMKAAVREVLGKNY
jgi:type I restriction enzyme S subunit